MARRHAAKPARVGFHLYLLGQGDTISPFEKISAASGVNDALKNTQTHT